MKARHFIPTLVFAGLAVALYVGLGLDPRETPFALRDKPVPVFSLPSVFEGGPRFSDKDLKRGEVSVVNFFATWCGPCLAEHPFLLELSQMDVAPLYAVDYKDSAEKAAAFLRSRGNPFDKIGQDPDGRTAIDWGLAGVPETFVVDQTGRIVYRFQGAINRAILTKEILPLIERLKK